MRRLAVSLLTGTALALAAASAGAAQVGVPVDDGFIAAEAASTTGLGTGLNALTVTWVRVDVRWNIVATLNYLPHGQETAIVLAKMGVDPAAVHATMDRVNPIAQQQFQNLLFSKIVPNCKKLGLLDASDGWLRERFTEIGVIQFEDFVDTTEEYLALDGVAADRAAG
mgnify:CR=1 FL=1